MLRSLGLSLACGWVCVAAQLDAVSYGRYLVDVVGKCGECHTPVEADGESVRNTNLRGAALGVSPICDKKNAAKLAPDLTPSGRLFSKWGERQLVKYLETGFDPQGATAQCPMPAYKLRPHDAEAIVTYLKTLR